MTNYQQTNYKQVILLRQDLKLPRGKLAGQAAHASVDAVLKSDKKKVNAWLEQGMPKIVLKVKDERELLEYHRQAKAAGLVAVVIADAGKTVLTSGTKTAVGIGPDEEGVIDTITGKLPLL